MRGSMCSRAQIAFVHNRGAEAPPLLLAAASRLEQHDVRLARDTYLDAVAAAIFAGRLANGSGLREVGEAARVAASPALLGCPTFFWMQSPYVSPTVTRLRCR
ncbi:hypothetical protein [Lentzea indica]|uniref:hypothetical protein n=1 Tax=Lentzea indica TaxID=2604800 RepID=UPI001438AB72|nr:hypothetical protein [Lentzea indica]